MAAHHHLSKGQFHKGRGKHVHKTDTESLADEAGLGQVKREKREEQPIPKHYRKKA